MTKIILAVLALVTVAGCAPTMQELSATCAEYGFQPDTTAFLECRQREMQAYEAVSPYRRHWY